MFVKYPFSALLRPLLAGASLVALGLAASCTYSHGEPEPACDAATQTITYAGVISPIFDVHCRECHGSTVAAVKGGGNDFGSYQAIKNFNSNLILGCIKHAPGFDPMPQNRDKLSDCDIERIERWIAAGKPEK